MMRILLAEDEDNAAEIMRRFLGSLASVIDVRKSLDETLMAARTNDYDIIILDLRLTDSEASHSIEAIRTLKHTGNAPLLVVTGVADPDIERKCREAGADAYMHKIDAWKVDHMEGEHMVNDALMMALHAAILHHPKQRSHTFIEHVQALERLIFRKKEPTPTP